MRDLSHGPRWTSRGVELRVFAPAVRRLEVQWRDALLPLARGGDGFFAGTLEGARTGERYALVLDGEKRRPDPASRAQPQGVHEASALFDPRAHAWKDGAWRGMPTESLIFYELHLGTFTQEGTFDAAVKRLPDLVDLGITCVELMPVQPFPGERNWGYDGVSPYAVHDGYGGPAGLQRFVDAAHALGLAVCLDVVYNHLGPEGNYLRDFGPYFTARHRSPWGDGLDFDGPDAAPMRQFMIDAAVQWVRDFHVDVLRLDAVHAITDESEPHLVADLAAAVHAVGDETGRKVCVIGESDLNDRKLVEPRPGGWGLDSVWADDLHHAIHALLTGERASFYADYGSPEDVRKALSEGFVLQGQRSAFRKQEHGTPTKGLLPRCFTTCSQNHDQVGNRPNGERLSTLIPFEALPAVAATVLLGSGIPLVFMGEEYGETQPFLYFTSHSDPDLARAVSEGRKREFIASGGHGEAPDPQSPKTFEASRLTHRRDGKHGRLREEYKRFLALRKKHARVIAESFPEVKRQERVFTLVRPGLTLAVNLGPKPEAGLEPWEVRVTE
jgi:maltooligosyltrehalose trehalohydrolase